MTLTIIKVPKEASTRLLLQLIDNIRYNKLYEKLEYLQRISQDLPKTKVNKK